MSFGGALGIICHHSRATCVCYHVGHPAAPQVLFARPAPVLWQEEGCAIRYNDQCMLDLCLLSAHRHVLRVGGGLTLCVLTHLNVMQSSSCSTDA